MVLMGKETNKNSTSRIKGNNTKESTFHLILNNHVYSSENVSHVHDNAMENIVDEPLHIVQRNLANKVMRQINQNHRKGEDNLEKKSTKYYGGK